MRTLLCILVFICLNLISCTSKKCTKFFTYKSTKVDIKGISAKLKKNGKEIANLSIGSIFIDPKFVQASEELQRLDLYQKTLCEQLNAFKNDSLKNVRRNDYVSALIDMVKIAQKPDSFLANRVEKLEIAELRRSTIEQYLNELRKTPPNLNAQLFVHTDGEILYSIEILNDVPIKFRMSFTRFDNKPMTKDYFGGGDAFINPNKQRKWVFSTKRFINDPQLPQDPEFKVKISIFYYSVFIDESNAPGLSKILTKVYSIDRTKLVATEVKE